MEKTIEIPFGAKDSELKGWEYTIPEDMEAEIKDGKIIVKQKESEDERIRKHIIDIIKDNAKSKSIPCDAEIDYLERQKERVLVGIEKMTHPLYVEGFEAGKEVGAQAEALKHIHTGWNEKDKQMLRNCIDALRAGSNGKSIAIDYKEHEKWMESLLDSFTMQKERGPLSKDEEYTLARIIEYLEDNDCPSEWKDLLHDVYSLTYQKEQKPAEWSEEYRKEDLRTRFAFYTYKDEDSVLYLSNVFVEETSRNKGFGTKILQAAEMVAQTIGALTIRLKVKQNTPANDWYRRHGYGYLVFEDGYDWLEKNLEYLKPKQEWSEADKLHINNAILVAKKEWGVNSYTARFLEALRDNYKKCNSRWKPSEEQMWALDVALEKFYHPSDRSALESLRTDLKNYFSL